MTIAFKKQESVQDLIANNRDWIGVKTVDYDEDREASAVYYYAVNTKLTFEEWLSTSGLFQFSHDEITEL